MADTNDLIKKKADDTNKWDRQMDLTHLTVNQLRFMGQAMADSGMFPDIQKDAAKAMVKIMAGQEIGVTPFQAVTGINIIQGKASMGANLMASKLKGSDKYDYRTKELSSEKCTVVVRQRGDDGKFEDIGEFTFSMEDAKRQGLAGKDNWRKFPQNMLFARAISNAIRIYAPDVFNGTLVYEPDELGATTSETGEVVSTDSSELDEALAKIAAAKDEDELTDIVTALPAELQKNVVEAAQTKFSELGSA
jgi:hypothetical protein